MKVIFDFDYSMVSFGHDNWMTLPEYYDRDDYRYSHGGSDYQRACEWFWSQDVTTRGIIRARI